LFINNDSVGYRDLGDLAFLDSDGETLASITSKANQNNTVTAQNVVLPKLAFSDLVARTDVTQGLFVDNSGGQDSVVKRTLSSSAFSVPTLTEVLTAGDSTNLHAVFADGIELPERGTPIVTSPNVSDDLAAGFYRMLIINDDTDSVARGNIGTIVNTVSQETLQTVTTRGADAEVAAGRRRVDSTDENLEFAGTLFYTGVSDLGSSYDNILVVNDSDREIRIKSLSTVLSGQNLHSVATNGNNTNLSLGANGFYIYDGTGFTDGSQSIDANHVVVIDSDRDAFFRNLDASGLTTLDSTSIVGGFDVTGETTLDKTTIDGLLDANAGIDASSVKVEDLTSGRVVIAGTSGELEDDANLTFDGTALQVGVNLNVDGITTLDSTTIDGTLTVSDSVSITGSASNLYVGNELFINTSSQGISNHAILQFGGSAITDPDYFIASIRTEDRSTIVEPNRLVFYTGDSVGDQAERMYLNEDGAQINQNLNVDGITTLDSTRIDGRLGINTGAPDKALVVSGNGADAEIVVNDQAGTPALRLRNAGSTQNAISSTGTSQGQLAFTNSNGNEFMTADSDKLQLKGDTQLHDAAGTNLVIYDSAGAVLWGNV
jgi:hypothetical protein